MANLITTAEVADLHLQKLSKDVRVAAQKKQRFRQFVRPETEFGPHMGDQYKFVNVGNITEEAREVGETDDLPQGTLPITAKLCTCKEYSLEIPYTSRASLLSELSLESMIIRKLMDNAVEKLDRLSGVPFLQCDFVYTPIGTVGNKDFTLGTAGVALDVSTRPMSAYDFKNIVGILKSDYNVPGFGGGNDFIAIVTESTTRSLGDDAEYVEIAKRVDPAKLLNGEVARYYSCRIIQENNVLNDNLPNGCGQCVIFGDDPVVEIELYPLELQRAIAESYGRTKGIRWTWYGGFARTWSFATEQEVRIIRVDSLAA